MKNLDYLTIGQKVKTLRKHKRMTQEDLADFVGITPSYLSYIENGFKCPSLELLLDFCDVLDTTPDFILAEYINTRKGELAEEVIRLLTPCSHDECLVLLNNLKSIIETMEKLKPKG